MSRDEENTAAFVPFEGSIRRSSLEDFPKASRIALDRVGIDPKNQALRFRHQRSGADRHLEPVTERRIDALVLEPGQGRKGTLVTFAHPNNPKEVIGVLIGENADDDLGEVDGVWVAEEDGTGGGDDDGSY